jgi:hypothetical protein
MTPTASPPDLGAQLRSARAAALAEAVRLLLAMAEDAERFAKSAMARLDDLPKAQAYREAARRVGELK